MDKSDYLQLVRLLTALESAILANRPAHVPDYIWEWMSDAVSKLEKEILK
jgi:hypothetical protein